MIYIGECDSGIDDNLLILKSISKNMYILLEKVLVVMVWKITQFYTYMEI